LRAALKCVAMNRLTKFLSAFLVSAVTTLAQDFAPESIANHLANYSATGVTASFSTLFTPAQSFRLSPTGAPLGQPMAYTWTVTGANTATLVESDSARTNTTALTFTAPLTATFRVTSTNSTTPLVGTVTFSAVPQSGPPLVNISTRAALPAGQILTAGFVVGGNVSRRVLVRAVGPTLATLGVPGAMANPSVSVFRGATQIQNATNDDWGGGAALTAIFASVGAFALPVASLDAALVLTLAPGNYSAQVRGTGAGEVIVEIYFVD
jgi:hypothetical protein